MEGLRISAKNLGRLNLPDQCPRCSWLQIKSGFKFPYQIFPGIFSSIDLFSKEITNVSFQEHRCIPRWFSEFGKLGQPIAVPHHSKFRFHDDKTDTQADNNVKQRKEMRMPRGSKRQSGV